jgi:glucose 1-dehydrogenase
LISSSQTFAGKVALVTGASRGIGRAAALALASAGAKVILNYRSHPDEAEQVVGAIRKAGSEAIAVEADVADQASVERLVSAAVENFGQLDIAVANAAYSDRDWFYQADMAGFRRTVDVTMWGAFYLLRAAAQQMIRQGREGVIVVVSSPHAFIPTPRAMAYNMSKAAIEQMAKTAAIELAEHRIRVNIIQPGWIDTPGERKFASEETLQAAGAKIPLGRLGTAEEIAEGIRFLCDFRNSYMTGASLLIDGGISLPWWANRGSVAPAD